MRMLKQALMIAAIAAGSAGCSLLLDFSPEGLRCDDWGNCLEGYYCAPDKTCRKLDPGGDCENVICAAGEFCAGGQCMAVSAEGAAGSPCQEDEQCGLGAFCLRPYGGGSGLCTRGCEAATDCGGNAPDCRVFDSAGSLRRLCVPFSFRACVVEATCESAGLTCGVYGSADGDAGLTACRARNADGQEIGAPCTGSPACANGLCIEAGGVSLCTTPCTGEEDCRGAACTATGLAAQDSMSVAGSPSLCGAPVEDEG